AGVVVAPGAGVVVAPGAGVAVENGVAVGTAVVAVGTGAAAEGVGVGVVEADWSGPLASAVISSTTPSSASSPRPPASAQGARPPPPARLGHLGLGRGAAREAPLLIRRERAPAARAAPLRRGRRDRGVMGRRRDRAHPRRSAGL